MTLLPSSLNKIPKFVVAIGVGMVLDGSVIPEAPFSRSMALSWDASSSDCRGNSGIVTRSYIYSLGVIVGMIQ